MISPKMLMAFVERCEDIRNGSPNAFYAHVDAFCKDVKAANCEGSSYDYAFEAQRIIEAIEPRAGATMTLICALREAYAAGVLFTDRYLQRICDVAATNLDRAEQSEAKYYDLIYAVGNKHEGESRHETALRYIRQAEQSHGPASAKESTHGD